MRTPTLSRRRFGPAAALVLVAAAAAWVGVLVVAGRMDPMPGTMGIDLGSFVAVWTLMMTAMMLPSVAPFTSLYTRTFHDRRRLQTLALCSGYLLVWSVVALPAYGLAWVAGRLVADHAAAATALAALIFAACGMYQLTGAKHACLARCRSPLGSVVQHAGGRGPARPLRVGIRYGAFCVGCCWGLMALLVAFGLMNLWAMVALTAVVLAEKTMPRGPATGRAVGGLALGLAVLVVFVPGLAPGLHEMAHTGAGSATTGGMR